MRYVLPSGCMGLPLNFVQGPCVSGIDVRPGSYDIHIGDVVRSKHFERNVLRPVFIGKVKDERECLFAMINYGVRHCVIDARPETTLAKRLQEEASRHYIEAYRAQYNSQPSAIEMTLNEAEKLYTLERTMTLDVVHHHFQTLHQIVLPANYQHVTDGQFASEMCSSTRTPSKWHGRDYWMWVEKGPDHSFHAMNMMFTAARISGLLDGEGTGQVIYSKGEMISSANAEYDPGEPEFRKQRIERMMARDDEVVFDA